MLRSKPFATIEKLRQKKTNKKESHIKDVKKYKKLFVKLTFSRYNESLMHFVRQMGNKLKVVFYAFNAPERSFNYN